MKSIFILFSVIVLSFETHAREAFDELEIQNRFSRISSEYNSNINYAFPPNCWGTMFNVVGIDENLDYLDSGPVVSFFLSESCEQKDEAFGHSFVHIDSAEGAMHSYYLGSDMMAWQKFDPNEFSLIVKEPHEEVIDWYNKLEDYAYDKPFKVSYFNCDKPNQRFQELFNMYINPSKNVDDVLSFINLDLENESFDMGLYWMMLYSIEMKTSGPRYLREDLPESLKSYEDVISLIKEKILESTDASDSFALNALLDFYLDTDFFLKILTKMNEAESLSEVDDTTLKKVLYKIEHFASDESAIQSLLGSSVFNDFVHKLVQNENLLKPHFLTDLMTMPQVKESMPQIYNWMLRISRSWVSDYVSSASQHYILFQLFENGILEEPIFPTVPDPDYYHQIDFSLAPGNLFPNSYIDGWQDDF